MRRVESKWTGGATSRFRTDKFVAVVRRQRRGSRPKPWLWSVHQTGPDIDSSDRLVAHGRCTEEADAQQAAQSALECLHEKRRRDSAQLELNLTDLSELSSHPDASARDVAKGVVDAVEAAHVTSLEREALAVRSAVRARPDATVEAVLDQIAREQRATDDAIAKASAAEYALRLVAETFGLASDVSPQTIVDAARASAEVRQASLGGLRLVLKKTEDAKTLIALRGLEARLELMRQKNERLREARLVWAEICVQLDSCRRSRGVMLDELVEPGYMTVRDVLRVLHGDPDAELRHAIAVGLKLGLRLDINLVGERSMSFDDVLNKRLREGTVIFEGAQGVLLDEDLGFYPHVTGTRTTTTNFWSLLSEHAYSGETEVVGVTRCYTTRHGHGPLPTEDASILVDEPHNATTSWAGRFRVGCLDLPLLRYALDVCGRVDSLAVSHLDRWDAIGALCRRYAPLDCAACERLDTAASAGLVSSADLAPLPPLNTLAGDELVARQSALTLALLACRPLKESVSRDAVVDVIERAIGKRVSVIATGPETADRHFT